MRRAVCHPSVLTRPIKYRRHIGPVQRLLVAALGRVSRFDKGMKGFDPDLLIRFSFVYLQGESWYENQFIRRIGATALLGLLYTIVIIFAMQADKLTSLPMDILRISMPLIDYFILMFVGLF